MHLFRNLLEQNNSEWKILFLDILTISGHTKIDGDSSSLLFVNVGEKTNVIIPIPKNLQDIAECHLIQVFRMKDNPHADLTRISCSLPQVNITNKCLCDLTTHSTLNVRINNIEYKDGGRWLVNVSTSTEQKSFNFYLDVMAGNTIYLSTFISIYLASYLCLFI